MPYHLSALYSTIHFSHIVFASSFLLLHTSSSFSFFIHTVLKEENTLIDETKKP